MPTWRAGGATVTNDGGKISVAGDTEFAADLRAQAALPPSSFAVLVAPPPGGYVAVHPRSAWLVNAWFSECAAKAGHEVVTDFVPGRLPRSVAQLRAEARRAPEFDKDGNPTVFSNLTDDEYRQVLPRRPTREEEARAIANPAIRAALEEAHALPPYAGPDPVRDAIFDRVRDELDTEPDEDERARLLAVVWDALGFGWE